MMEKEKCCSNCLFEYTCDWSPAAGEDRCEDWRSDEKDCEVEE